MSASELPTTALPSPGSSIHPAFFIASWIVLSNLTILFNKWLIDSGFPYPVILTCWHLVFATAATQLLARTTTFLDSRKSVKMTGRLYLRTIVPIGLLYSASLVCSNVVYLYLSVAFIQILKAAAPVAVLFTSWAWGVASPNMRVFLNLLVIVFGVGMASVGEIQFSWLGFMFQAGGIIFEAMRLVMIQVMLSEDGQKMDPLVSLYYYAPVCAVMNFIVAVISESHKFQWDALAKTGVPLLVMNATIAFLLNVSSVFLIGKTSGLGMTLAGILKNILLFIASVMIWQTAVSGLQILGYAISLAGLVYYYLGWEQIKTQAATFATWMDESTGSAKTEDGNPTVRRWLVKGIIAFSILMVVVGLCFGREVPQLWARVW